ncbi:hypothetical protein Athai_57930 [Actinocatenispora thailandica]|uniref:Lipoprotein n=1 Tax=Actinocatenispora thailandica TaxID=227318 RepID=A0A7R7DUX4_9ACTN|nr:hypothetical protein [Actinocatenispora thailandica]BCJ38290.1 hypothetical protein Athai_57930 [Actinocatenispora thailandica]
MRTRTAALTSALLVAATPLLTGCGGGAKAPTTPTESPTPAAHDEGSPADRLAGLVAAAADKRYVARYEYSPGGRKPTSTITVTLATDGSWRFDVPKGGLGGGTDVAVAGNAAGVYQCGLGDAKSCARVAGKGGSVPAKYDPKIERLWLSWLGVLGDRSEALSIDTAKNPSGVPGSCFSVEPTAASLSSPVPSGTYCLDQDGVVTGARLSVGSLTLVGAATAAPKSVKLPGPVAAGGAVPTTSPSPSPSASASASASASPSTAR